MNIRTIGLCHQQDDIKKTQKINQKIRNIYLKVNQGYRKTKYNKHVLTQIVQTHLYQTRRKKNASKVNQDCLRIKIQQHILNLICLNQFVLLPLTYIVDSLN